MAAALLLMSCRWTSDATAAAIAVPGRPRCRYRISFYAGASLLSEHVSLSKTSATSGVTFFRVVGASFGTATKRHENEPDCCA